MRLIKNTIANDMNPTTSAALQDPRIPYPCADVTLPFSTYIEECRRIIQDTRVDLKHYTEPTRVIDANTPFELKPPTATKQRVGALLVHGLFDCPFILHDVAKTLQAQGLLVRSILLPGHGTVPGALLHVTYQEWLQTVRYGIENFAQSVDSLLIVGFSTGASLGLYHALQGTYSIIAGLVLLAPAIQISPFSCLTYLPPKLHTLSPRFDWLQIAAENDYTKYQSITFNSAYQVYLLTQEIARLSEQQFLKQPILVVVSADDKTVCSKATLRYFRQHAPKKSQLILYTNQPNSIHDARIIKRTAAYPLQSIDNISHVALAHAATNPHYGMHGDYPLASHIETNLKQGGAIRYGTLTSCGQNFLSALHRRGWYPHAYQRLSFNPDFAFMTESIRHFVAKIMLD